MTKTLWIVFVISGFAIVGFIVAMRSLLRENRDIDKNIDYSKLRPWEDDEDDDDPYRK